MRVRVASALERWLRNKAGRCLISVTGQGIDVAFAEPPVRRIVPGEPPAEIDDERASLPDGDLGATSCSCPCPGAGGIGALRRINCSAPESAPCNTELGAMHSDERNHSDERSGDTRSFANQKPWRPRIAWQFRSCILRSCSRWVLHHI